MDNIPLLCIDKIAKYIAEYDDKYRRLSDVATDMINLISTGNFCCGLIANFICTHIDPSIKNCDDKVVLKCQLSQNVKNTIIKQRFKRITKTRALKHFKLTAYNLLKLPYIHTGNPNCPKAPLKLYLLSDVVQLYISLHGSEAYLRKEGHKAPGRQALERKCIEPYQDNYLENSGMDTPIALTYKAIMYNYHLEQLRRYKKIYENTFKKEEYNFLCIYTSYNIELERHILRMMEESRYTFIDMVETIEFVKYITLMA